MSDSYAVAPEEDLAAAVAAADAGDTLLLAADTYEVDEPLRRDANHVTIRGQGPQATEVVRTGDFPLLELYGAAPRDRLRGWLLADLRLVANPDSTADLLRAKWADLNEFRRVNLRAKPTTGNGVHAQSCWDWEFEDCWFRWGGDPERGTADVYATNTEGQQTNNFNFVGCCWERVASHAIYLDSSNGPDLTRKFRLTACKLHGPVPAEGNPDQNDWLPVYFIDGTYQSLSVVSSQFEVGGPGYIRIRTPAEDLDQENGLLVANSLFQSWDPEGAGTPAIDSGAHATAVTGNTFYRRPPTDAPAVSVGGTAATVTGNVVTRAGIAVRCPEATVTGNQVREPPGPGVLVAADGATVNGNAVVDGDAAGVRVEGVTGASVGDNTVQGCETGIRLADATGVSISDNVVRGPDGTAVEADVDSEKLAITGNVLDGRLSLDGEGNATGGNVRL